MSTHLGRIQYVKSRITHFRTHRPELLELTALRELLRRIARTDPVAGQGLERQLSRSLDALPPGAPEARGRRGRWGKGGG